MWVVHKKFFVAILIGFAGQQRVQGRTIDGVSVRRLDLG
jgi:hypothetical protein